MVEKYKYAATNYTLENQTLYACGMPREDAFNIFRDPVTADIPWTGATIGLTILALFVWCQDQVSFYELISCSLYKLGFCCAYTIARSLAYTLSSAKEQK